MGGCGGEFGRYGTLPPAEAFARLNAVTEKRFTGIGKSTVPVLLPFDVDAFRQDVTDSKPKAATSEKYFGGFHPTKFFLPGPAGDDCYFYPQQQGRPAQTPF